MSDRNNVKQLLVEGNDDKQVVYHLSNFANIPREAFETREQNGYAELLDNLEVFIEGSEIASLGVIVDADNDLVAKWTSLKGKLEGLGYMLPANPQAQGIIEPLVNRPTIGIWIMPNNTLPGTLEDFIAYLIPDTDTLWEYACQCVGNIAPAQRRFKQSYERKAFIHTWLAWQEEPGTPLGQAITKRYLDASRPDAQAFIAWLRRLYNL